MRLKKSQLVEWERQKFLPYRGFRPDIKQRSAIAGRGKIIMRKKKPKKQQKQTSVVKRRNNQQNQTQI